MVVSTTKGRYIIGKNISLILPEEIAYEVEQKFAPPENHDKCIREQLLVDITDDEIQTALSRVVHLVIEPEQSCNMACRYCIYGGDYNYYRHHTNKTMSFLTAQKAIDFFYHVALSQYQVKRKPFKIISFYGGESLLQFNLVMDAIEYALNHPDYSHVELSFSISTNGVLLTPIVVERLVKNNVSLSISLDGPESEHDRFRVFKDGRGTFQAIMANVRRIKKEYAEYYDNQIAFLITLHPYHDIKKIEDFFLSNEDLFIPEKVRINDLKPESLTNQEWLDARINLYQRKKTILNKCGWFYRKLFCKPIEDKIGDSSTSLLYKLNNFTRSCFPGGEKLFVDSDGNLHACEKINRNFSLGTVYEGFDIPRIKTMFQQWRKLTLDLECWRCLDVYLCHFCYASAGMDGQFVLKKEDCQKSEKTLSERIVQYLEIKEREDEQIHYNNTDNMHQFLESLQ